MASLQASADDRCLSKPGTDGHALARTHTSAQGEDPPGCRHGVATDVIFAERRGQSQKPEEIYELIEELVPNGTTVCKRARTHAATAAGS